MTDLSPVDTDRELERGVGIDLELLEQRSRLVQRGIDRLMHELVEHDPVGAFTLRAAYPGGPQVTEPTGVPGLRAAAVIQQRATAELKRWAREARGCGAGWHDIAQLLGADIAPDGEAAFEWLAGVARTVRWTCRTCGERVVDRGPYTAHPDDNEDGHASSCSRLAGARERYARDWADQ